MKNIEDICLCLNELQRLEEKKMFMHIFYEELCYGCKPLILNHNPSLELKYLRFKQQYLMELATANVLIEKQYYLNCLQRVE